ncbi:MAG: hypothetical protein P0S93_00005 [Candidatus Neptunochlamydia sp.]|nr:hypothetical protein [Candidatus Neptunochlamydia sp.]
MCAITDNKSSVNDSYNQENEVVEQKKDVTAEPVVAKPAVEEKTETVAEEIVEKAVKAAAVAEKEIGKTKITKEAVEVKQAEKEAPVQKVALPAVNLKKITRKDVQKKDVALVKAHIPSRIKDKNIKWDPARNVVVIVKSGKNRAYQLGHGAAPALKEGKLSDVIAYLNKM